MGWSIDGEVESPYTQVTLALEYIQYSWSKTFQYYLFNMLHSLRLYTDKVVFNLTIFPIPKCDGLLILKILFKRLSWPLPMHRNWQMFFTVSVYFNSSRLIFFSVNALYFQSIHLYKAYVRFFLYLSLDWVSQVHHLQRRWLTCN